MRVVLESGRTLEHALMSAQGLLLLKGKKSRNLCRFLTYTSQQFALKENKGTFYARELLFKCHSLKNHCVNVIVRLICSSNRFSLCDTDVNDVHHSILHMYIQIFPGWTCCTSVLFIQIEIRSHLIKEIWFSMIAVFAFEFFCLHKLALWKSLLFLFFVIPFFPVLLHTLILYSLPVFAKKEY